MMELSIDESLARERLRSKRRGRIMPWGRCPQGLTTFLRLGLPVILWIIFVNVAHQYQSVDQAGDLALSQAIAADLAARRCPGFRLDLAGFRQFTHASGINYADLYQKQSSHLRKYAIRLDASLRAEPTTLCRSLLKQYGSTGPHLLRAN